MDSFSRAGEDASNCFIEYNARDKNAPITEVDQLPRQSKKLRAGNPDAELRRTP